MTRRAGILLVSAVALAAALGHVRAAHATAPPSIEVQVIGKGRVTGTGLNCGEGSVACYSGYGSLTPVTLKVAAAPGWTFSGWEDSAAGCGAATSCPVTPDPDPNANATATAVFTTTGAVQTATYGVALSGATPGGTVKNGSSTDAPIDCPGSCSATVPLDSTITVIETPTSPNFFSGWGGACTGQAVYCATYMNAASKTVTATWVNSTAPTTLEVTVDGNGSVTGGGISCGPGSTCDAQEPPTASETLTATPASGYAFTGWGDTGDCTGTSPTCTVQMDQDRSAIANFAKLVPFSLTVGGAGTVSGEGVGCGPGPQTCAGATAPNQTVTFTATPTAAGGTVSWSGCSSQAGLVCSVIVTTNAFSVTATFAGGNSPPPTSTYALTLAVQGDGGIVSLSGNSSVHCTAAGGTGCFINVPANSSLTLSAVPASGTAGDFQGWTNACAGFTTTSCTLTMNGPKSVGANFAGGNTTYLLSGQVTGNGTISGAGLNCSALGGTSCSAQQPAGATVTLSAAPSAGASFTGWSGACSGTSPTCQVSMTTAKSVSATFSGSTGGGTSAALALSVTGAGRVTAPGGVCESTGTKANACAQQYSRGQTVVLTAKPAVGYVLAGWSGACSGRKATCDVTLSSASLAVGATFARLALAPGAKPKVVGRTVTLFFVAHESGKAVLTAKGPSRITSRLTVKSGSRRVTVGGLKRGRYTFTLTLTTATGAHAIRWRVTVK